MKRKLLPNFSMLLVLCLVITLHSQAQVSVLSFSPASGASGTSVTISGTGFNTTPANNTVFFGAQKASVTASSATSITVTVPAGSTYGPITITNTGTNLSAYSKTNFTPTYAGPTTIYPGHFRTLASTTLSGVAQGSAVLKDMDGDGKNDIVLCNRFGNAVSILRNTGSVGVFSFAAINNFAGVYQEPTSVSVADMDGDGKPDMIGTGGNLNGEGFTIYRNTSTVGNLSFTSTGQAWQQSAVSGIGDFDGDGKPDVVIRNNGTDQLAILRNTTASPGNISLNTSSPVLTSGVGNPYIGTTRIGVADINGDGKPDIIRGESLNMVVYLNNSSGVGNISFSAAQSFAATYNIAMIVTGDFNNDGKIDIITNRGYGGGANNINVFQNTSTSNTLSFTRVEYNAPDATDLSLADFNGDGKVDIYASSVNVSTGPNSPTFIYQNTSTASTVSFTERIEVGVANSTGVLYFNTCGDIDGDGKPEAVGFDGNLRLYTMQGIFPVQLLSFNATQQGNAVKLDWKTAEESNIEVYDIQRSIDGKNFSSIGVKKANNINNSTYSSYDENPQKGTNWYRLYIKSKDNRNTYSSIATVKIDSKGEGILVYPNPVANGKLNLQMNAKQGDYAINLVNNEGKIVWSTKLKHAGGSINSSYNLSSVPKGSYTLQVKGETSNFIQNIVF